MALQGTDVEALRAAVRQLEAAAAAVTAQLDRLVGQEPATAAPPASPVLHVIDDTAYPQDFWMDAEDEGLGGGR